MMRSRERLIEVLASINPNAVDSTTMTTCNLIAEGLKRSYGIPMAARVGLAYLSKKHSSPHIRDLFADALHYIEQDAHQATTAIFARACVFLTDNRT